MCDTFSYHPKIDVLHGLLNYIQIPGDGDNLLRYIKLGFVKPVHYQVVVLPFACSTTNEACWLGYGFFLVVSQVVSPTTNKIISLSEHSYKLSHVTYILSCQDIIHMNDCVNPTVLQKYLQVGSGHTHTSSAY